MTRGRRVQVLDLGTHLIKGLVADVSSDGQVRVREARTVALPSVAETQEQYLSILEGPLRTLMAGLFRKGHSVDVVGSEDLVRTGLRRLVHSGDETLPRSVSQSRQQFVDMHGVRQKTFASSVVMRREQRGDVVEVLVAHGYVRWLELEQLSHVLQSAGLGLRSLLPRVVALDQMSALWQASQAGSPVTLLVDAGFSSTTVALLQDGRIVNHKLVFAGALDLMPEESGADDRRPPLDPFVSTLVSGSFDPRRLAVYFRAVKLAIAGLPGWPSLRTARGPDAELEEEDAPDDESAPPGATHESALFTGGLAHCPGFGDRARSELGLTIQLLQPGPLVAEVRHAARTAPLALFTHAIGAARLAARAGVESPDVAAEYIAALAGANAAAGWRPTNRRFLTLAACFLIGLCVYLGRDWSMVTEESRRLEEELAAEESSLEPDQSIKEQMKALRQVRRREEMADAKVRFLNQVSRARPDWFALFEDLRAGTVKTSLAIPELTVETAAGGSQEGERIAGTELRYRVTGEAPTLVQITELVKALKATRTFVRCNVDDPVEIPRQVLHGREHKPHLAFNLSGTIPPGSHEEN